MKSLAFGRSERALLYRASRPNLAFRLRSAFDQSVAPARARTRPPYCSIVAEALDMAFPKPPVHLAEIRHKYHAAVAEVRSERKR